jgi:hypothetical protein
MDCYKDGEEAWLVLRIFNNSMNDVRTCSHHTQGKAVRLNSASVDNPFVAKRTFVFIRPTFEVLPDHFLADIQDTVTQNGKGGNIDDKHRNATKVTMTSMSRCEKRRTNVLYQNLNIEKITLRMCPALPMNRNIGVS